MIRALLPVLLSFVCTGCIRLDRVRDGSPEQVLKASKLLPGKTTLKEAIVKAGPPDLMLRAGPVDRLYYTAWDSDYFKFIIRPLEGPVKSDLYIQSLGWETQHLSRLEFDRGGILRDVQTIVFKHSRNNIYFLMDNRFAQYLEDKSRALALSDEDDDDEDVELDEPAAKKKKQGN